MKIYNEPVLKKLLMYILIQKEANEILCYTISEIIAEKLRSLMQRTAPRDLYDVWFLLENEGYEIIDYIPDFIEKAKFKELNPKVLGTVLYGKKEIFKKSWEYQLTNQLNDVLEFEKVWRTLQKHIKKLQKAIR
ncbi:MAG: nucleotidyl transferase AbiEii/AbiGii toxin family protein [Ignavibacteria bacterium]|nr:nucleotidyl transferase AbiEii/AbiGii toxin family protein [Ignavibacteria bacterium]